MRSPFSNVSFALLLLTPSLARSADLGSGSLDVHWDLGATTCPVARPTPFRSIATMLQTFILREKLCSTWEAPFMYLLIGGKQALLIDTGDIADPN